MNARKPGRRESGEQNEAGGRSGSAAGERADNWRRTLQECVVAGVLFKAVMADLRLLETQPSKLSYRVLLEELSRWAERRHHELRRRLREQGCVLLTSERLGHCYRVGLLYRGYQREAVYSIEWIKAECEQQMRRWLQKAQAERTDGC